MARSAIHLSLAVWVLILLLQAALGFTHHLPSNQNGDSIPYNHSTNAQAINRVPVDDDGIFKKEYPPWETGPKYYWIDQSCFIKLPKIREYLQEVFQSMSRAADRLASDTDTDFARVYKVLTKADKNDPTTYTMPLVHRHFFGDNKQRTGKELAFSMYLLCIRLVPLRA